MQQKTYGFLHCHSEHSLKDSPLKIRDLCQTAKDMGATAISLTDHGTCTGIIEFLDTCKSLGLNGIPGVEAYVKTKYAPRAHLVLLAKNYRGYQEISMAVSESNKHLEDVGGIMQPVMNLEILKKYFGNGNVYALSACITGILSTVLLANAETEKKIKKLQASMKKTERPDNPAYLENKKRINELDLAIDAIVAERDRLKKLAEKSYQKRLKGLATMESLYPDNPEMYEADKFNLYQEIEESNAAKKELDTVKNHLKKTRLLRTNINKRIKKAEKGQEKFFQYQNEYQELEKVLKTKEELLTALKSEMELYRSVFKEDFYVELQYHGMKEEGYVMPILSRTAKEMGIPVVATNDVHIRAKEDAESRQFMKALRFHKWEDPEIADKELYMKTDLELYHMICKIIPEESAKEAMRNIRTICDQCHVIFPDEKHYPQYRDKNGQIVEDAAAELKKQTYIGIKKRFPEGTFTQAYMDRMEYELKVIIDLGYANYLLIVADYINFAKDLSVKNNEYAVGYGVGPGRGSGAGCLVNYLLGITNIDPIKYGLIFERFLNKDRVSMPDIDTDFSEEVRNPTIEYVKSKYGKECVAIIRTLDTQGARDVVRNSARVLGWEKFPGKESDTEIQEKRKKLKAIGNQICKEIPQRPGIKLTDCEKELAPFRNDPTASIIIRRAMAVEGTATGLGSHAAGVIIGDGHPLKQFIPLLYNTNMDQWSVQCNMVEAEEIGLLKMDFLALTNLDVSSECLRRIKANYGRTIDLDHLAFESEVFREIFSKGNTSCVFQLESGGMKRMLKEFKPDSIEDLIALVALYRPGPMDFIPDVIAVKQGRSKPHYIVPQLKKILDPTYGQPVYQEQLMDIFHQCAGFSLGEADIIRRYMSKKKVAKFLAYKPQFISGIIAAGAKMEEAEAFWESLTGFAKYAFNKSHAAVYAVISYQTAWLKYHYPVEYMCSVMNHADTKKLPSLLYECRKMNIKILPPDINRSQIGFSINNDGDIIYGLRSIKGISSHASWIIEERNRNGFYESFLDFLVRAHENKGVTETLIKAGTFDQCGTFSRTSLLYTLDDQLDTLKNLKKKIKIVEKISIELDACTDRVQKEQETKRLNNAKNSVERAKLKLQEIQPKTTLLDDDTERLQEEYELLGAYISDHPLNSYKYIYENDNVTNITDFEPDTYLTFAGMITNLRMAKRKSDGADMAFFTLEDLTGTLSVNCFTKAFEEYGKLAKEGNVVKIYGKTSMEEDFSGSDEEIPTITVRSMEICRSRKKHIFISVKDQSIYEEYIKKKLLFFSDDGGHPIYLHFCDTGDIVVPDYYLNSDILETEIKGVVIQT